MIIPIRAWVVGLTLRVFSSIVAASMLSSPCQ
jgi:hypothetical protein